ncbi:hypothetical protein R6Q59_004559 [Mikania micrantha]
MVSSICSQLIMEAIWIFIKLLDDSCVSQQSSSAATKGGNLCHYRVCSRLFSSIRERFLSMVPSNHCRRRWTGPLYLTVWVSKRQSPLHGSPRATPWKERGQSDRALGLGISRTLIHSIKVLVH